MAEEPPIIQFRRAAEQLLVSLDGNAPLQDDVHNAVTRAIATAHAANWAPTQLTAFQRIEALRTALRADQRVITITDYGAGPPGEPRTKEQMERGVRRQVPVWQVAINSKPPPWAQLIHQIVCEAKPRSCLEMGTCVGLTAAYVGLALEAEGESGKLTTLEGADSIATIARNTLATIGVANYVEIVVGPFSATLGPVLDGNSFDFVFVDGHHDRDATIEYWRQILPCLSERSIVVFDDIRWSPGMQDAWAKILADP